MATAADQTPWLGRYIDEALEKRVCVKVGCTTCGASEFRYGLYRRAAVACASPTIQLLPAERPMYASMNSVRRDECVQRELATQLSLLNPDDDQRRAWFDAVRLIFCDIWNAAGAPFAERAYQPIMKGTWAGTVLRMIQVHHAARQVERRRKAIFESPEAVAARREAERRARQLAHAERLERKKERDRLWYQQHSRDDHQRPESRA